MDELPSSASPISSTITSYKWKKTSLIEGPDQRCAKTTNQILHLLLKRNLSIEKQYKPISITLFKPADISQDQIEILD